jgi:hypothetical protein
MIFPYSNAGIKFVLALTNEILSSFVLSSEVSPDVAVSFTNTAGGLICIELLVAAMIETPSSLLAHTLFICSGVDFVLSQVIAALLVTFVNLLI